MDIILPHQGKRIQIFADNPVEKIYTKGTAVSITSPTGEVLTVRPKNYKHSAVTEDIPIRKTVRQVQHDNPFIQNYYRERGSPRHLQLNPIQDAPAYSDGINPVTTTTNSYFINEAEKYMLSHNIDMDLHVQKLRVAFQNLENLETQFHSLLNEFANPSASYAVDANTRRLISNFVTHLDYIKSGQTSRTPQDLDTAPALYNYYTQKDMGIMDMLTLSQWETFKKENTLNGLIKARSSPGMITPQVTYGTSVFDYQYGTYRTRRLRSHHHHHGRRVVTRSRRRAQDVSAQASQARVDNSPPPYDGYTRVNLPQRLSKEQLAVFILMVEGTESHYDILFRMLPQKKEIPSDIDNLIFQDALVLFHKVSQFATITYMTLENIWNDLNEIDIFYKAIPNTMMNTLSFYRLDDDFLAIKCRYGNNTQGVARLNQEFGNLTASIQKTMDQVLVDVFNSKMDVSTLLAQTQPYREYKGQKNLYSQEFQRIMRQAIGDVETFWDQKEKVNEHLDSLRKAQIELRDSSKALSELLERHKKLAAGVGLLGHLVGAVLALVLLK
jgi:hypothetical protein